MQAPESQTPALDDATIVAHLDQTLAAYERQLTELEARRAHLRDRLKAIKLARKALTAETATATDPTPRRSARRRVSARASVAPVRRPSARRPRPTRSRDDRRDCRGGRRRRAGLQRPAARHDRRRGASGDGPDRRRRPQRRRRAARLRPAARSRDVRPRLLSPRPQRDPGPPPGGPPRSGPRQTPQRSLAPMTPPRIRTAGTCRTCGRRAPRGALRSRDSLAISLPVCQGAPRRRRRRAVGHEPRPGVQRPGLVAPAADRWAHSRRAPGGERLRRAARGLTRVGGLQAAAHGARQLGSRGLPRRAAAELRSELDAAVSIFDDPTRAAFRGALGRARDHFSHHPEPGRKELVRALAAFGRDNHDGELWLDGDLRKSRARWADDVAMQLLVRAEGDDAARRR